MDRESPTPVRVEEEAPPSLDQLVLPKEGFEEGQIVEGTIVRVTKTEVYVDVDYKSEGILPIKEFMDSRNNVNVKVGDTIRVLVLRQEDKHGYIVISKIQADEMAGWYAVEGAMEKKEPVEGIVDKPVKGGVLVKVQGLAGFLPVSQMNPRPADPAKLEEMVGQKVSVKVIKVNRMKSSIVFTQRAQVREDRSGGLKRTEIWSQLKEGDRIKGYVKTIVPYGAFVDIGGVDGLLHMNDMSWTRISSAEDVVALDQDLEVVVLKLDRKAQRISLGLKQLTPDPWVNITERYTVGQVVQGKVVNLMDYGAFVKMEEGIEGLVHISEMSWTKRPKHPSQMLAIGDNIEAVVLSVDPTARRLSLGLKQLEADPWAGVEEMFPIGSVVKGSVKSFADFGAFIELSEGVIGLLHLSDMSWTKRYAHPSDVLKRGDRVEVQVLKLDREHKRLALGMKQLTPDPWLDEIPKRFLVGSLVKGRVTKLTNFGAFVELEDGIEGLLHVSEIQLNPDQKLEEALTVGQELELVVIKIDTQGKKLGVSLKALTAGLGE